MVVHALNPLQLAALQTGLVAAQLALGLCFLLLEGFEPLRLLLGAERLQKSEAARLEGHQLVL